MNNKQHKLQRAFTLVELMTVVAIITILAGVSIPQYQKYMRRSVCENGKAVLMGAGQVLERYHAQNNKYAGANLPLLGYSKAPVDGKAQFDIVLETPTPSTYKLTATANPDGKLRGKGTLTLDNIGTRGATGDFDRIKAWNSCSGI